jgi:cytidylate kinase
MNKFRRLFKSYYVGDIFTPNRSAKIAYVERDVIESDLEKYIALPGNQIFMYGHSGSGKTTLIRKKLSELKQNFIKVHCETSTTFNDILLQSFDELNRFYTAEKSTHNEYSISSELKADFKIISSAINTGTKYSEGAKSLRIVPPQLTPQKLSYFLGEIKALLIIEDFHKVSNAEKQRIADVVKIFIDCSNDYPEVKIVCIGAVGTARELIQFDNNLSTRVAELYVPLLSTKEIEKIVKKGNSLMNITMSQELIDKIVYYSNNLASITHQICYDLCFEKKIKKSSFFPKNISSETFKKAIDSFVRKNSDTFNKLYELILNKSYGWNILKTFDYKEAEFLSFGDIKKGIPERKFISDEELGLYLYELTTPDFNEILRYNRISKKYSISTPFFRAFLKMKLALEQSERRERNKQRNNKRNRKYSIDNEQMPIEQLVLDESFFKTYYQYLDSYTISEIKREKESKNKNK